MVKVLMELEFGEVRARAVVRRISPTRGMGIEFIAMTQEDRARLNKALQPMFRHALSAIFWAPRVPSSPSYG